MNCAASPLQWWVGGRGEEEGRVREGMVIEVVVVVMVREGYDDREGDEGRR